ncbi:hypothetical protein V6N13_099110 [Hibiscus sabdariffa]
MSPGSGRGRGAMMRPHPLPLMFDNTFTGRSARQVSTMILPQACFEHSNFFKVTAPEERPGQLRPGAHRLAVGTSRPVLTDQPGSIPSRRPSRMVLNTLPRQGRGHNEARASFVSRDKMHKLTSEQGLDPYAHEIFRIESTIEHRCTDVVESCRSTHSGTPGHD